MKVLYIDGVGSFGGASRSLYEVLVKIPESDVQKYFLAVKGTSNDFYSLIKTDSILSMGLTKFDHTKYGYYRKQRWLIVLREIFYIPFTFASIVRAKRKWRSFDIVHVNEITDIIPGVISSLVFRCPLVVHVRAVVKESNGSIRDKFLRYLLRKAAKVVAIDENVKESLPRFDGLTVINNSFSVQLDNKKDDDQLRQKINLVKDHNKICFGFVGNLHVSKGVFEIIDAISILKERGLSLQFFFVGGATAKPSGFFSFILRRLGLAQNVFEEVQQKVVEKGVKDLICFFGPTYNIDAAYQSFDVLCFPSHFDAPGRPVFEAAAHSVPSIVAVSNPRDDTFVHYSTGIAINKTSLELANAMEFFINNPDKIKIMGENANKIYKKNNQPELNAKKLMGLYKSVIDSRNVLTNLRK